MTSRCGAARFIAALAALLLLGGCSAVPSKGALDPESQEFYASARLIMTREENKIFAHLPDLQARREFIQDFWAKRDPVPETRENEYKKEFDLRVAYANKHYREGTAGINTDRGRILLYMGPPDKIEELFSHGDPDVRGSIIWWYYYNYNLGVEFVDENGLNQYKMRRTTGDFFEAMDIIKLGQSVSSGDVFRKKFVNFSLKYDAAAKEAEVVLPADTVSFKEAGDKLRLTLDFVIYVYKREGAEKEKFDVVKSLETTEAELIEMKSVVFRLPLRLDPGVNFVDVIIRGQEGSSDKVRKIFEIKVK